MLLRPADTRDLDALTRLEQHFPSDRLSRAHFRYLLRHGHADIRVCEHEDGVIGNAVVLYRRGTTIARLYSFVVRPDYQRRGIARLLLQAVEAEAGVRGCREMQLEVRPDNAAAIRFYLKAGYSLAGRIESFYEDGTEALKMNKRLVAAEKFSALSPPPRHPASGAPCTTL